MTRGVQPEPTTRSIEPTGVTAPRAILHGRSATPVAAVGIATCPHVGHLASTAEDAVTAAGFFAERVWPDGDATCDRIAGLLARKLRHGQIQRAVLVCENTVRAAITINRMPLARGVPVLDPAGASHAVRDAVGNVVGVPPSDAVPSIVAAFLLCAPAGRT